MPELRAEEDGLGKRYKEEGSICHAFAPLLFLDSTDWLAFLEFYGNKEALSLQS
jgi:hypothetical protein